VSTKLNLTDILTDHIGTLKNVNTGKLSKLDLLVFFGIPVVLSVVVYLLKIDLGPVSIGILISALSILAGLLINVLVLLYTVKEIGPTESQKSEQIALIKEVNANLLYEITLAILLVVLLCGLRLFSGHLLGALTAVAIFGAGNFTLTLLMAIKRIKVLIGLRFQ
jgi:hypothetical protein